MLRLRRSTNAEPYAWKPDVFVGLETRTDPAGYRWDGIARGGDTAHPDILFQYTLRGWGQFTEAGVAHKVPAGSAFVATIPSPHVYGLPSESPEWTFFFLMIRHPYVVQRISETRKKAPPIVRLDPGNLLLASAVRLFEGVGLRAFRDDFAREAALFDFLVEYERFAHALAYSPSDRERLLAETRSLVMNDLSAAIDVTALADRRGMSRSYFGHYFKGTTGLSPGKFITDVRLEEVSRRLIGTPQTLKTIAAETGFADANHLCKVFRKRYHLSPGAFRRQMR